MKHLSSTNIHIQRNLFPALEEEIGPLSPKEQQFVRILEIVDIRPFLSDQQWCGTGRKPHCRLTLAKAFIAKAVWNIPTTQGLVDRIRSSPSLRRLCGWDRTCDIPQKSTFSLSFEIFVFWKLLSNFSIALFLFRNF